MPEKPCRVCHQTLGHRIGCRRSIARANLIKAALTWHRLSHQGEWDACQEKECYQCHPMVLPG